jgi:hypothetical protein
VSYSRTGRQARRQRIVRGDLPDRDAEEGTLPGACCGRRSGHARWHHPATSRVANRIGARNLHPPENSYAYLAVATLELNVVWPKRLRPVVQRAWIDADVFLVQLTNCSHGSCECRGIAARGRPVGPGGTMVVSAGAPGAPSKYAGAHRHPFEQIPHFQHLFLWWKCYNPLHSREFGVSYGSEAPLNVVCPVPSECSSSCTRPNSRLRPLGIDGWDSPVLDVAYRSTQV